MPISYPYPNNDHQQEEETPAAIRQKLPEIQEQTKKNNEEAQNKNPKYTPVPSCPSVT